MKRNKSAVIMALLVVIFFIGTSHADDFSDTIEVFKKSPAVQPFFKNAYGYAVFPTVGKGGLGIGGAYGKGQVYQGGKATGETKLMKVTIGLQADASTQVVEQQRLMGLGNPQFEGQPSVLDRALWTGSGAAIVTADDDIIGVCFGNPRGDGTDSHF